MFNLMELRESVSFDRLCYNPNGELRPVDDLMDALEETKDMISFCRSYQAQLKSVVQSTGPLESQKLPGLTLLLKEKDGQPTVNADAAIPILLDGYFVNEELKDFVAVPLGAMKKALKSKTPPGEKKGRVDALLADLERAGAIERGKPSTSLVVESR